MLQWGVDPEITADQLRQRVTLSNETLAREADVLAERRRRLETLVLQQAARIERLEADLAERRRLREEEKALLSTRA